MKAVGLAREWIFEDGGFAIPSHVFRFDELNRQDVYGVEVFIFAKGEERPVRLLYSTRVSREIFTLASIYYNQDLHRGCLDGTQSIHINHASIATNKPVMSPTEARLMIRKFPFDEYDEQLHSANEKPSSQGLPPARENTGHTYSKKALPTICQTLKREPPILERRCRGRGRKKVTLICDRLLVCQSIQSKRSIPASWRTSIYPITINYHTSHPSNCVG